jgi:hypothetical protein
MIITLTPAEGDRVWKTPGSWPHYAFRNGEWYCYPGDPRKSPIGLISTRASQQVDGTITRKTGFEEVPGEGL